jgi:hypothetical protein
MARQAIQSDNHWRESQAFSPARVQWHHFQ